MVVSRVGLYGRNADRRHAVEVSLVCGVSTTYVLRARADRRH
jgi:hypothetical protein